MTEKETLIFYDGDCPVCSRAARKYGKADAAGACRFVNTADKDFQAKKYHLDQVALDRQIHVLSPGCPPTRGLDGLIALWERFPGYRWRARFARLPVIHALLDFLYRQFAAHRHWFKRS